MTNSPKIQAIVQEFIGKISQALAEEGSAAIRSALGGEMPAPSAKRRPGRPPGPSSSSSSAAAAPKAAKRSKGAKRTPEELESQTKALLAQIKKNPGQRIEVIGKAIGITTKDLALPIIKLLENKSITKKGQRRATTYFAK
jgi:hypothetical protein